MTTIDMETKPYINDIIKDVRLLHPDARQIEIIREDEEGDIIKVMIEVRTSTTSLIYTYSIDKKTLKICSRELNYAVPLL